MNVIIFLFALLSNNFQYVDLGHKTSLPNQAKVTIENNSVRTMTVKMMEQDYADGRLYQTKEILPYGRTIFYFDKTGTYFIKTKSVAHGRSPVCYKDDPFKVVNDDEGYSEITITYSITESKNPSVDGGAGEEISEKEFDKN
jgi:hypothetical protein